MSVGGFAAIFIPVVIVAGFLGWHVGWWAMGLILDWRER